MINFDGPVRLVMDCIEHLSRHQLIHSRMVSLYFTNRVLITIVLNQEISTGAQLSYLPDEISKADSFLYSVESHEEALLDWTRQRNETSAKLHKNASN